MRIINFAIPALMLLAAASEAPTRLTAGMSCSGTYCEAWAHGGSGTYVDFEWAGADELWEGGSSSVADVSAYCPPTYMYAPAVTVTDSNGAKATASAWAYCP